MRPGEESVRSETGKQIVWPTATRGGLVDLCAPHKRMHEGYAAVENQIAAQTGLPQEEPESLSAHHGTCAECARNTLPGPLNEKLKGELPTGYHRKLDQSDRRPRKPYAPGVTRTKPFEPLRQSENALGDATDWDAHYDELPDTVHRGYAMKIPGSLYDLVHDHGADTGAVAKELITRTGKRATGPHWSVRPETAKGFALDSGRAGSSDLPLVLHAHKPSREDIETRPHMLKRMQVFDFGGGAHDEREVPLRKDRAVLVSGISWHPHEEHPAADEEGWIHHDFSEPMIHKATAEELKPLPDKLYHVTTARDAVLGGGLRSREELGQQYGSGLGGGRDDTISLTSHKPTAEHLLHSLHEYHDVLNGKLKLADLKEKARTGVGAGAPYDYMLKDHPDEDLAAADKGRAIEHRMHDRSEVGEDWKPLDEGMHGTGPKGDYHLHMAWDRPMDRDELLHRRSDVYKKFAWGRQAEGGHLDPLFIGNDARSFADKDPSQFALLHVRPRPGAHGIQMNDRSEGTDAGEWRAMSGNDVNVVHHEAREDIPHRLAAKYPIKYTRMTQHGYEDAEDEIEGPLYHGSRSKRLKPGDEITIGRKTNPWGDSGNKSDKVHFTVHHDTARDYADQAGGHVYEIEPTGPFAHDYSSGDFKSYHPLRVLRVANDPITKDIEREGARTAAMHNPNAKAGQAHDEWYHGSPHDFDSFADTGSSNDDEDHVNHWNVLLGNHFTATHNVAHDFSQGLHHTTDENGNDDDEPIGHVIHARLHIKRPKVYKSEHDMDQEVHEHEVAHGNLLDDHLPARPHESAPDEDWEEYEDQAGPARVYRGDREGPFHPDEPDPNVAYGFHPKATGWLNHHPDKEGIAARFKDRLVKQGYDGIVYGNEFERADAGGKETSAIAFHPHQIEITQHHYGRSGRCLNPEECARQRRGEPHPGQQALPGLEHTSARQDPFEHADGTRCPMCEREDTGRLRAPLPEAAWQRFHGLPPTDWPTARDLGRTSSWDDDDEWDDDEEKGHYCRACDEEHADEETRDRHDTAYTDWDQVHPKLPDTLHRGMAVGLPTEVHDVVHDESRPIEERAKALADHVQHRDLGMHFTDNKDQAAHYSHVYHTPGDTHVIVHSRKPEKHHIETDPDELDAQQVIGYGLHDDNEIPLRSGAPVHATGISWKHEDPHADWHTHNFGRSMEMTAMRKQAHDSGDGQRIFHCPFCGAGQVIARSDGTVECEFCHTAFTVQVQPQFSSFPQTDPVTGQPIMIPGMPGQIDAPGTLPGAPGALPPGAEDDGSSNPFDDGSGDESAPPGADGGDDGGDNKPDFLKGSSFRTAAGDMLTEEAYARHLALRFSADPEKMIETLRSSR